jgi:hypothetical protein
MRLAHILKAELDLITCRTVKRSGQHEQTVSTAAGYKQR